MHILIALVALVCTCGLSFANEEVIQRLPEGASIHMTCKSTQHGRDYRVEWKKEESGKRTINLATGTRLRTNDRRFEVEHPDSNTWHLRLKQLRVEDSGLYVCEMTRNSITSSRKFRLIVGDQAPSSSATCLAPMFLITSMALAIRLL